MASQSTDEPGRERRAMLGAITVLTVVTALAVVAAILVSIHNARDAPRNGPHGIKLTADEAIGRELFAKTCSTCHTLAAANAVARVGPDLDGVRPSKALVLYALQNGFAGSYGQMPAGLYTGRDANDIASFVSTVAGR